ncbi:uncharacterized protein LOC142169526 [Nicotiana tabacum]|uniref:Uncharacterized protein LOC142169526 n=1 Tax=Nicotiana tabacum TaxID=4097 RepID=A0AC58SR98_TOBAC
MPMDRRLYAAAKEGDMKVLEEFKSQFTTQLTPYNNTVLHIAAQNKGFYRKNNPRDFLAMAGPELFSSLNSNGDTFIHMAARNDGKTTLHEAVRQWHNRSVVELLVKEDPDFSYPPNNARKTPLYLAVDIENEKALLEHILNNSTSPSYAGPYGTTVLHAAAMYNTTGQLARKGILSLSILVTANSDNFGIFQRATVFPARTVFLAHDMRTDALNSQMVSLAEYVEFLQYKACKQTSSEIASVIQTGWRHAMTDEMSALHASDTWKLIPLPAVMLSLSWLK